MSNITYTMRFTDPTRSSFTINPLTSNGPISPNSTGLGSGVVSANTTLMLHGKGKFDYGQSIQQNLIYLTENFANSTSPSYPIDGQLWFNTVANGLFVYHSGSWDHILSSGAITSDLNMNSHKVTNVAVPTISTDVATKGYVDSNYLNSNGGTISGPVQFIGANASTDQISFSSNELVPRNYVDTISALIIETSIPTQISNNNTLLNDMFVKVTGGVVNGNVTMQTGNLAVQVGNITLPVGNLSLGSGNVTLTSGNLNITSGDLTLNAGDISVGGQVSALGIVSTNGGAISNGTFTVSSPVIVSNSISLVNSTITLSGASSIDMAFGKLNNVPDPIELTDGVNKRYVDSLIVASPSAPDVNGGSINANTGVVTLTKTIGASITLTGTAAPFAHTHIDGSVAHNTNSVDPDSYLQNRTIDSIGYPIIPVADCINIIDSALSNWEKPNASQLWVGDDTTVNFIVDSPYIVGYNRLIVFRDGLKLLASERSIQTVTLSSPITIGTDTGLSRSTSYELTILVNGTTSTDIPVVFTGMGIITFRQLVVALNDAFVSNAIPCTCVVQSGKLLFVADIPGTGSSVSIGSSTTNDVIGALGTTTLSVVQTVAGSRDYAENGKYGSSSTLITFSTAPHPVNQIETLIIG